MKLLLADDEPFVVQGILDSVHWDKIGVEKVYTAGSGMQAEEVIKAHRDIDISLCDIEMPHGSGIDLIRWIRENDPDILNIILTAHDEFSFAQEAVRMQCFDYILKPATPEKIEEVILRAAEKLRETRKTTEYRNYGEIYVRDVIGKNEEEPTENQDVVAACTAYIREHIQEQLSVNELAADQYVSPDYLTRLFRKKLGKTPLDYIRDQRMFLAKEMLENTDLSVTMISAKVGYGNYGAFITSFRKYYGMTPGECRTKAQEKK